MYLVLLSRSLKEHQYHVILYLFKTARLLGHEFIHEVSLSAQNISFGGNY